MATTSLAVSALASGILIDRVGHRPLLAVLGFLMAAPGAAWLLTPSGRTGAVAGSRPT